MKSIKDITLGLQLIDNPNWMGGVIYTENIFVCLSKLSENDRPNIVMLGNNSIKKKFFKNARIYQKQFSLIAFFLNNLMKRFNLIDSKSVNVDVIYPGFGSSVLGAKNLEWIPDFQHKYFPEYFSKTELEERDSSISAIANSDGTLVLSSQATLTDFKKFYPSARVKTCIWKFCSPIKLDSLDNTENVKDVYNLPEKYIYLPNQFWAHKNHLLVLDALLLIREKFNIEIPLVCTGAQNDPRNSRYFKKIKRFLDENKMSEQTLLLGLIPRRHQIEVFRNSTAIIQPSRFEGWSTIVEDNRAIGRPIYLSDIPVHVEQDPPNAKFFSPESVDSLIHLLVSDWGNLRPGPDYQAEFIAQQALEERIISSAYEFCNIIRSALD